MNYYVSYQSAGGSGRITFSFCPPFDRLRAGFRQAQGEPFGRLREGLRQLRVDLLRRGMAVRVGTQVDKVIGALPHSKCFLCGPP